MNRHFRFFVLVSLVAAISCDDVDRTTFEGNFSRIVTVVSPEPGIVGLDFDCTGESYTIRNFRKSEDLGKFNLKVGSRGVAQILYDIVPSAGVANYDLDEFNEFDTFHLNWGECPRTDLETYFYFSKLNMGDVSYPNIWSKGHYINTSVWFYPNPNIDPDRNTIDIYPTGLRNDTLCMKIITDFPESNTTYAPQMAFLEIDMSEIKNVKSQKASLLYSELKALGRDTICVELSTCDSLEMMEGPLYVKVKGDRLLTKIALDF